MRDRFGEHLGSGPGLERVAEIARALAECNSLDETLHRVVELAVGYIEHCDGATMIFVGSAGEVSTPAWTSEESRQADLAQHHTGEGPCLQAMWDHETVVIDDMASEERWPEWRAATTSLGWRSMLGLRLFVAQDTMGALDLYSRRPHGFDVQSQLLGEVFASHAAVAMKAAITERGLRQALDSRDVIGQAKGVLMEREKLTPQQAFDRLRQLSNDSNLRVVDLAKEITETGAVRIQG